MLIAEFYRRIEQASDHCLQCSELDMEIGKGSENLVEAREEVSTADMQLLRHTSNADTF